MSEAIEKVNNKELSLGEASKTYILPKATLFRHVVDRNKVAKVPRSICDVLKQRLMRFLSVNWNGIYWTWSPDCSV